MASKYIDATEYLMGGSNPHIFPWVSSEETTNWLLLEDCLAPSHGKKEYPDNPNYPIIMTGNVRSIYRSVSTGNVYIAAGDKISRFTSDNQMTEIGNINSNTSPVFFVENQKNQILIIDGTSAYVHNTSTGVFTKLTEADNKFQIEQPNSVFVINDIAFVGNSLQIGQFQPSNFNDFLLFQENEYLVFEGEPDVIMAMGTIRKNAFIIGKNHIERFVTTPNGAALMAPDQVWNAPYGLVSSSSFVNKFNMIVGLFSNKQGSTQVRMLSDDSDSIQTLTTPGVMKDILEQGDVLNADLYEIDGLRYYELAFKDKSYIYNFNYKTWTYSTSPFEQVVFYNDIHYGARGYQLFELDYYNNTELKTRIIKPLKYLNQRFSIGESEVFIYNKGLYNPSGPTKKLMFSLSTDNSLFTFIKESQFNEKQYYQPVSFFPQFDGYQFSLKIQTKENIQLSALRLKIIVEGK